MANPCSLRPGEAQEKVSLCSSWKVPRQTVFDFNFRSDRISSPSDVPTWSYNHKSLFRKMLPLPWLVLVAAPLVFSQPAPPNCCETKTVGGVSYTWDSFLFFFIDLCWSVFVLFFFSGHHHHPTIRFVREDTTAISYSCLSPCVYERDDQPGTAFCFAQGDQQVVMLVSLLVLSGYQPINALWVYPH